MPTALDLRPYAGQWIAEGKYGDVITSAPSLDELEAKLIQEYGFTENNLPPVMRVPEDAAGSFLL